MSSSATGTATAVSTVDRVAVVVVHGIADQRAGQTVRELARLLCHGGDGEPRYVHGEMHEILVPVARLEPAGATPPAASPASAGGSRKTDPGRRLPGTPSGFYQAHKARRQRTGASDAGPNDLGLALNDYLLGRLELSEQEALYESTRVSLRRRVLSLVLWSMVGYVAGNQLKDFNYLPVIFGSGYRSAQIFLDDRIRAFGSFFTPLVLAFSVLGLATLFVLAPSLLEEIRPTRNVDAHGPRREAAAWSERLGRWLGGGLRWLARTFALAVPSGAFVGGALYLAFVARELAAPTGGAGEWAERLAGWLDSLQGGTLVAAGQWLAGGAVTIAALGSRFTQTFGRLRVTIDAVLDVDNYFRDPPDRQPPRARIYSRYASLLAYLRDRGYSRIVIVAHSQGTVISADLLRYLHVHRRLPAAVGGASIALVTVGSPLRDLYAERFPLLYRWMGSTATGFGTAGPSASDIGAVEWVNACRSGDYVGRFLWTPTGHAYPVARIGADGRAEAERAGDRAEFCLGAGAHTHYFDNDAVALAVEIDRLVGPLSPAADSPPPPASGESTG